MDAPGSEVPKQIVQQFYGKTLDVEDLMDTTTTIDEDWLNRNDKQFSRLLTKLEPYDRVYQQASGREGAQVSVNELNKRDKKDPEQRHEYVRRLVRQGRYINLLIGEMTRRAREVQQQELKIDSPFNLVSVKEDISCEEDWNDCKSFTLCKVFADEDKFLFDFKTDKCEYIKPPKKNPIDKKGHLDTIFALGIFGITEGKSINSYLVVPTRKEFPSERKVLEENLPDLYDQIVGKMPSK